MFTLTSPAFIANTAIPARYTCDDADVSPPLNWIDAPKGTRSFALIVDDPDAPDPAAPQRVWVHWLRYNIPAQATELPEGAGGSFAPQDSSREAVTDSESSGYHGPCPRIGRHRYYFRLFALDAVLPELGPAAKRRELERAMQGHVIASAVLMGTYARDK